MTVYAAIDYFIVAEGPPDADGKPKLPVAAIEGGLRSAIGRRFAPADAAAIIITAAEDARNWTHVKAQVIVPMEEK